MIPSYIVPKYNHLIKKLFACRLKKWNNRQITSFISCPNIFASTCSTQISVSQISVPDPFPAQATQISVITFFHFFVPTFFVASFKTQELISNFCASPFATPSFSGGGGGNQGEGRLSSVPLVTTTPHTNFCASPFHKFLCTSFCASFFSQVSQGGVGGNQGREEALGFPYSTTEDVSGVHFN